MNHINIDDYPLIDTKISIQKYLKKVIIFFYKCIMNIRYNIIISIVKGYHLIYKGFTGFIY